MDIIHSLKNNINNVRGFTTNRKIIVIESDDWGSIRMPSKETYELLAHKSKYIKDNPYCQNDTLATKEDLEALFDVLLKFKDKNGRHPVITANTVVGNPDFQKIKDSNFTEYYYEPFVKTLKNYYPNEDTYAMWEEGIKEKLFYPQFHGREHVNASYWLQLLQNNQPIALSSFEQMCWAMPPLERNIQASYDVVTEVEEQFACNGVDEGLTLFENLFGYKSQSFIANNFIWSPAIEKVLDSHGVQTIQGMKYQKMPLLYKNEKNQKRRLLRHLTGTQNKYNQVYLVRNCVFEPSQNMSKKEDVTRCFSEIKNAFFWKKPAIITVHRLNFIGKLNHKNRSENLKKLEKLLALILKTWPDVEFMTSDALGQFIIESKN